MSCDNRMDKQGPNDFNSNNDQMLRLTLMNLGNIIVLQMKGSLISLSFLTYHMRCIYCSLRGNHHNMTEEPSMSILDLRKQHHVFGIPVSLPRRGCTRCDYLGALDGQSLTLVRIFFLPTYAWVVITKSAMIDQCKTNNSPSKPAPSKEETLLYVLLIIINFREAVCMLLWTYTFVVLVFKFIYYFDSLSWAY